MKSHTYILVSYAVRLPNGGFGFGRRYVSVAPDAQFSVSQFERDRSQETGGQLTPNCFSVVSKTDVDVEEYNLNVEEYEQEQKFERIRQERRLKQQELDLEQENIKAIGDTSSGKDLREELDGSSKDDTDTRGTEEVESEEKETKEE